MDALDKIRSTSFSTSLNANADLWALIYERWFMSADIPMTTKLRNTIYWSTSVFCVWSTAPPCNFKKWASTVHSSRAQFFTSSQCGNWKTFSLKIFPRKFNIKANKFQVASVRNMKPQACSNLQTFELLFQGRNFAQETKKKTFKETRKRRSTWDEYRKCLMYRYREILSKEVIIVPISLCHAMN